jgi:alpha-beta hydrolase superfamily lysophospholipase
MTGFMHAAGRSSLARIASRSPAVPLALLSADRQRLHASLFRSEHPVTGLLLVHGLQSHSGWFEASATAAELADAGISSLAVDRRGSGRSAGSRGHMDSAGQFLMDLHAGATALRRELDARAGPGAPMHVLANCFGTRVVLAYVASHPQSFRSMVLTAPAIRMSRRGSYRLARKLAILFASPHTRFPTPLRDEYFVPAGPWLDWIRSDARSLRQTTAGFLRSANRLTRWARRAIPRLRIPMLVILGRRDALVDNDAIRRRFFARHPGPKQLVEYDAEHYVDFTSAQPAFRRDLEVWLLGNQS